MRICLATPLYPPESGGPATYAKILTEELPKKNVDVLLVKFRDVRDLPKMLRHIVYAIHVFFKALKSDCILVLDPISTGFPALIASVLSSKKLYVRVAGDYAWEQGTARFGVTDILDDFVEKDSYGWQVRVMKWVQKAVARHASRIIVPSEYLKRMVGAWGIDTEKIDVVYNAPPVLPDRATLVRPPDAPHSYIVCVARLVSWKGIEALIRALKKIRAMGTQLNLVIVGDGPEEAHLRNVVREVSLEEHVLFTGLLSNEKTASYVAHADAFVLNTHYEGFSHVILEAFELRVPVLTTGVGGNPELVHDMQTGLIFLYNDVDAIVEAIMLIKKDMALRTKIIAKATEKISQFTRAQVVTGTLDSLTRV